MAAEDAEGPAAGVAAIGFHAYADDTLRLSPGATPAPREALLGGIGDEPPEASLDGPWPGEPPVRRGGRGAVVALTLAVAAGAAVALAWELTPASRRPVAPPPPPAARRPRPPLRRPSHRPAP